MHFPCTFHTRKYFFDNFYFHPKIEGENKSQGTATIETLLVKKKIHNDERNKGNTQVFTAIIKKDIKEKVINIKRQHS